MNVAQIVRRPLIVETMYQQRWLESALAREIFLVVTFNLLLIATAQVSIPLAAGVPITGQTFGVLLTAMALGRVRGVGVIALYLAEGAAGLPVFASGGAGPATFLGPTGGYLLGFLASAWLVGALADRGWDRSYVKSLVALTAGTALIFVCGLAWLSQVVSGDELPAAGLYPFLPGAALKIAAAFWLLPQTAKLIGKQSP